MSLGNTVVQIPYLLYIDLTANNMKNEMSTYMSVVGAIGKRFSLQPSTSAIQTNKSQESYSVETSCMAPVTGN